MAETGPIAATLPGPPTTGPAVPAPPSVRVALPSPPTSTLTGRHIPIIEPFILAGMSADGGLTVSTVATSPIPGRSAALGELTVDVTPELAAETEFGSDGHATGRVVAGGSAVVLVDAEYSADTRAGASNAHVRGVGALSAVVVPHASVASPFHTVATAKACARNPNVPVSVAFSGTGTASATAAPGFRASGMNTSETQSGPATKNTWAVVTKWAADTTNYPGSVVDGNALVCQGTKTSATVSASVSWSTGTHPNSISARLLRNGNVIATGTAANPATATATVDVAAGDRITLEISDASMWAPYTQAVINAGGSTYVRVT